MEDAMTIRRFLAFALAALLLASPASAHMKAECAEAIIEFVRTLEEVEQRKVAIYEAWHNECLDRLGGDNDENVRTCAYMLSDHPLYVALKDKYEPLIYETHQPENNVRWRCVQEDD